MAARATQRHAPDGLILAMACVAQFMVVLDVSIVNIALPKLQGDLHFTASSVQWVVNAYVLTFAGFLLLGGRAADLFGRRAVYLVGLTVFTLASVGAGFASSPTQMIAARAIQGLGGAILGPSTLTIIITTFQGPKLPRAIGVWSAVAGGGGAVGGLLGGLILGATTWRWIFFINVPLGILAGLVAIRYLREMRNAAAAQKLDVTGAILVTAGLASLVYAIVNTTSHGWTSTFTLRWIVAAAALLIGFAFWESRIASHPLLPFRVFKSRALTGADSVMLLIGAAFFSMWYFLTFYFQEVHHFGPVRAGLAFLPMSAGIIAGAQIASRLIARAGVRPIILTSTLLGASAFYWMSLLHVNSSYAGFLLAPSVLCSFSMGLLFTPLATAATSHVDRADAGLASGVLNTGRQIGGSLGLAALVTASAAKANEYLHPKSAVAQTAGYSRAFVISAGILLLAFAVAWVIPATTARHDTATVLDAPSPTLSVDDAV